MLGAVCLLALAAVACARPDAAPAQVTAWNYNNSVSAVQLTTEAAPTRTPPPALTPPPAPTSSPSPAPAPKLVHERFPFAVLFGGTCGGSIIADRWVLTAGHCTLFTSGRNVLAGTSNSDDGSGTLVRVKKLHLHPRFSVGPYWVDAKKFDIKQVAANWDFMLVELESPLPLDYDNIATVALYDEPEVPAALPVGYAGYGAEHHGGLMRPDMHAMELRIISDEQCSKLEQYNAQDMVCAVGRTERRDSACNGDSGSGLVTEDDGPVRLIGIASWVENDAHECRPGATVVFSRVSAVRDWIKQVTGI